MKEQENEKKTINSTMMKINKFHKKEICKCTHIAHLHGMISILYLRYVTDVSRGV
jgi:hypothetical protein